MSEIAPEATETVASTENTPEPEPKPTETVEFWKAKARDQEKRAKANADAAKRLAELEQANQTEAQRLDAARKAAEERAADLAAKYTTLLTKQAVTSAAATAGAIDADAVYALIRGDVQVDDEGMVTGVEEAITALHQQKPHLFTTTPRGTRDASAGGHTPRPADDPIREFTRGLFAAAKAQN